MIRVVLFLALTFQCVVSDKGCPLGWRLFQEHCYGFFAEQVSWNLAASSCHVYNSYLTKIERAAENDWIVSVLKSLKYNEAWTGGSQRLHPRTWEWVPSGESFGTYSNWNTGEPNNGGNGEWNLELRGQFNYKWNDHTPATNKYFICERSQSLDDCDD